MAKQLYVTVLAVLLLTSLSSCSKADIMAPMPKESRFLSPLALPPHVAYVLSGLYVGVPMQLTLLNADTWAVIRTVQLPQSYSTHLSRDPQGRLWIGYQGIDWDDDRVQVFAPDGQLLQTLHPCRNPGSGVQFANGKAFVICNERGFFGTIVVIDLITFRSEKQLHIEWSNNNYTTYSSGGDERYTFVLGVLHGSRDTAYTGATLVNLQSQQVQAQLETFEDAYIGDILSYQGKYYLLNPESWRLPRPAAKDIFVVTPSIPPVVEPMTMPVSSPNWGKIIGDVLFTYHNPTKYHVASVAPERAIVRLDLKTGASQVWSLPDNWDANDLEVVNGKIILLHDDGLYEFDPADGQLRKRVAISVAWQLIVTP